MVNTRITPLSCQISLYSVYETDSFWQQAMDQIRTLFRSVHVRQIIALLLFFMAALTVKTAVSTQIPDEHDAPLVRPVMMQAKASDAQPFTEQALLPARIERKEGGVEPAQTVMVANNVLMSNDWHLLNLERSSDGVAVATAADNVKVFSGADAIPGALLSLLIALLAVVAVGRRVS